MSATLAQLPFETPFDARPTLSVDDVSNAKKRLRAVVSPESPEDPLEDNQTEDSRIALVLDVDECLVHSKFYNDQVEYRQQEARPDSVTHYHDSFEIVMEDGERAIVNKRPGLDAFLEEASKHFDLYAFTAGLEAYASPILDQLDPKQQLFKGRFFRESCVHKKGMFLKDLHVVRRDLSRVIFVDNNPVSFLLQPSNGVPVPSFYDDANDRTLTSLTKVLHNLKDYEDVRPRLHQLFRLADLLAEHRAMLM